MGLRPPLFRRGVSVGCDENTAFVGSDGKVRVVEVGQGFEQGTHRDKLGSIPFVSGDDAKVLGATTRDDEGTPGACMRGGARALVGREIDGTFSNVDGLMKELSLQTYANQLNGIITMFFRNNVNSESLSIPMTGDGHRPFRKQFFLRELLCLFDGSPGNKPTVDAQEVIVFPTALGGELVGLVDLEGLFQAPGSIHRIPGDVDHFA
jgi:hypothetical protein